MSRVEYCISGPVFDMTREGKVETISLKMRQKKSEDWANKKIFMECVRAIYLNKNFKNK